MPEHILARVVSFDSFGWHGLLPVGFVLAAAAATVAPANTIVSQDPAPGTKEAQGSIVNVKSKGPAALEGKPVQINQTALVVMP